MFHSELTLYVLIFYITLCSSFWFYGYEQIFREPYSETTNNEIVPTSVITYLASRKNDLITVTGNPYSYKLFLFESIIQYESSNPNNKWNIGIWDGFDYCDDVMDKLCLLFSDGEYCDAGYFRSTTIEVTCNYDPNDNDVDTSGLLYNMEEYDECLYYGKLYFKELCQERGPNTVLLRPGDEIDKIKASSWISKYGNKINKISSAIISGDHDFKLSMSISEVSDLIHIVLSGPINQYFAIGFGSNSMSETYSIVVKHTNDNDCFFEQLLDEHESGYTLDDSFILQSHKIHDGIHTIVLERRLSSAVNIDEYWVFSTVDDHIDIIWSVGESTTFEHHIASGHDRLYFEVETVSYVDNYVEPGSFKLHVNWTSLLTLIVLSLLAWYFIKKYKGNFFNRGDGQGIIRQTNIISEYGSAQDVQPLIETK